MDASLHLEGGDRNGLSGMWFPADGPCLDARRFSWCMACQRLRSMYASCSDISYMARICQAYSSQTLRKSPPSCNNHTSRFINLYLVALSKSYLRAHLINLRDYRTYELSELLKYCYRVISPAFNKIEKSIIMSRASKDNHRVKRRNLTHLQSFGMKGWQIVGIMVMVGVTLMISCNRPDKSSVSIPEVEVVEVDTASLNVYGEYEGVIRASQSVEVTARVEGVLEKMLFQEGSYVTKGQTLFVIDPKLYQARVERSQAQLDRAKALLAKAQRDLNRIRPLYTQKAASQLDLDNAEAAVECALADVEICKVDLLESKITLGYTRVVAPISGYISERMVDVGALVGPGGRSLLATIVRSDTVLVDFQMTSLEYLKSKDRKVNIMCEDGRECFDKLPSYVNITLADGSEYQYKGLVDFADPVVDTKTGTFTVRAEMPNPEGCLLPGETTKVKVLHDIVKGAMTVPAVAVRGEDGDKYVFVVSPEGIVEKRQVSIGEIVGKRIIVSGGLKAGEMVAINKFDLLSDGIIVNPVSGSKKAGR